MLRGWQTVTVAMLVWGNWAFASVHGTSRESGSPIVQTDLQETGMDSDLQTIASWRAHLNRFYPGLNVKPAAHVNLKNAESRQQMIQELAELEEILGDQIDLPAPYVSLQQLACGRPECTGGGGGKCSTCEVDKD